MDGVASRDAGCGGSAITTDKKTIDVSIKNNVDTNDARSDERSPDRMTLRRFNCQQCCGRLPMWASGSVEEWVFQEANEDKTVQGYLPLCRVKRGWHWEELYPWPRLDVPGNRQRLMTPDEQQNLNALERPNAANP
jgi:hypothetical protein